MNATTLPMFKAAMEQINAIEPRAFKYLMDRNPKHWSKAFFREGMNCAAVENGVSESFNSAILDARRRPLITMLEDIRVWAMERLFKCRQKGENWDLEICPAIRRKLEDLKVYQRLVSYFKLFNYFDLLN